MQRKLLRLVILSHDIVRCNLDVLECWVALKD
jgi:hypothetical protein